MPRRRFSGRRSAPTRKFSWEWAGLLFDNVLFNDGDVLATWARVPATSVDTANNSGIPYVIPADFTLIRSRVLYTFFSTNNTTQANATSNVAVGLIEWDGLTDDTLDIGTMPHPYYDQEEDWVFLSQSMQQQQNIILQGNGGADVDGYQSKAMRKLSAGNGLLLIFGWADPLGINGGLRFNGNIDVRMLFKGP